MTRIALWLAQHQLKSKTPARRLKALQRLRTALNNAVVALDDKITIALLDHVLTDPEVEVRREATAFLGDLRDVRTLPALIRALSDHNEAVQEIAIAGLKRLDDRAAIAALVPKLSNGTPTNHAGANSLSHCHRTNKTFGSVRHGGGEAIDAITPHGHD